MKLLIPLGLLGLLGIVVLFIIYFLKPNYQNKTVSSTFVWKLSIKYKKKRLPISKLRNILLIICQILVIVACAMILAKPAQVLMESIDQSEVVIIIDSSASMRTVNDGVSRYEKAVGDAYELVDSVLANNGIVSVIVADKEPKFLSIGTDGEEAANLALRVTSDKGQQLKKALNDLTGANTMACSFGTSDMEKAMELCSDIVDINPDAKVYLYTDSTYAYVPAGISVVNEANASEWNASIVNAYSESLDNHYSFVVEVACYGRSQQIDVQMQIQGLNTESKEESVKPVDYFASVYCTQDTVKTVIFTDRRQEDLTDYEKESENVMFVTMDTAVTSYQSVYVILSVDDSFTEDNNYVIYNGIKEILKVQYASTLTNPFVNSALDTVRNNFTDRWDVRISEIRDGNYALEGFDFYIFEHSVPEKLPTDGVVFIIDPDKMPSSIMTIESGVKDYTNPGLFLTAETEHPIMQYIKPEFITVTRLKVISSFNEEEYQVAMSCENNPALLIRDEQKAKVVVMPFSLHFSNFAILPYFATFFSNMFSYFLPATVQGSVFEVNEDITLNSRGGKLEVSYSVTDEFGVSQTVKDTYESFPATMRPEIIGTYVLTQKTLGDKTIEDSIYVRVPSSEYNIFKMEENLKNPFIVRPENDYFNDLLLYFAIALVSLLCIEWLLQMRDNA